MGLLSWVPALFEREGELNRVVARARSVRAGGWICGVGQASAAPSSPPAAFGRRWRPFLSS